MACRHLLAPSICYVAKQPRRLRSRASGGSSNKKVMIISTNKPNAPSPPTALPEIEEKQELRQIQAAQKNWDGSITYAFVPVVKSTPSQDEIKQAISTLATDPEALKVEHAPPEDAETLSPHDDATLVQPAGSVSEEKRRIEKFIDITEQPAKTSPENSSKAVEDKKDTKESIAELASEVQRMTEAVQKQQQDPAVEKSSDTVTVPSKPIMESANPAAASASVELKTPVQDPAPIESVVQVGSGLNCT